MDLGILSTLPQFHGDEHIQLTVFSFGGGQDSTYMLMKIIYDPSFRKRHVRGRLIVVFSDTGDEHPHTYENLRRVQLLCVEHGIEFYWLEPGSEYHSDSWQSLTHQFRKNACIGSAAFTQTCTDNLKVKPIDRFVEVYIEKFFGYQVNKKKGYHEFYQDNGVIRLILGFAKGEEKRTSNGNKFDAVWKRKCVARYYPLLIDGISRQDCINYLESIGWNVFPSNCMLCFYQSDQEIVWLERFYPERFEEWVELEAAKLIKWWHKGLELPPKNYGVYGLKTLREKLEKAKKLYGHWTDEQLIEYKYSHGHCIKSKY